MMDRRLLELELGIRMDELEGESLEGGKLRVHKNPFGDEYNDKYKIEQQMNEDYLARISEDSEQYIPCNTTFNFQRATLPAFLMGLFTNNKFNNLTPSSKWILILGAGLKDVDNIYRRSDMLIRKNKEQIDPFGKEANEIVWSFYESARADSFETLPIPSYYYLYKLLLEGYFSTIISTNYDLFI